MIEWQGTCNRKSPREVGWRVFCGGKGVLWVSKKLHAGCHWQEIMGLKSMRARLSRCATAQQWLLGDCASCVFQPCCREP